MKLAFFIVFSLLSATFCQESEPVNNEDKKESGPEVSSASEIEIESTATEEEKNGFKIGKFVTLWKESCEINTGDIFLLDTRRILIKKMNFTYVYPGAYSTSSSFLVGYDSRYTQFNLTRQGGLNGFGIAGIDKDCSTLFGYDKLEDVILTLPDQLTWYDLNYLSIYEKYSFLQFGYLAIPEFEEKFLPIYKGECGIKLCSKFIPTWWEDLGYKLESGSCPYIEENDGIGRYYYVNDNKMRDPFQWKGWKLANGKDDNENEAESQNEETSSAESELSNAIFEEMKAEEILAKKDEL